MRKKGWLGVQYESDSIIEVSSEGGEDEEDEEWGRVQYESYSMMEVARTFLADNAADPPQSFPVLGFFPKATLEPPPKKDCTKSSLSAFTTSNHFLEIWYNSKIWCRFLELELWYFSVIYFRLLLCRVTCRLSREQLIQNAPKEKNLQDKELTNVINQKHTPNKKVDLSTIEKEWK